MTETRAERLRKGFVFLDKAMKDRLSNGADGASASPAIRE